MKGNNTMNIYNNQTSEKINQKIFIQNVRIPTTSQNKYRDKQNKSLSKLLSEDFLINTADAKIQMDSAGKQLQLQIMMPAMRLTSQSTLNQFNLLSSQGGGSRANSVNNHLNSGISQNIQAPKVSDQQLVNMNQRGHQRNIGQYMGLGSLNPTNNYQEYQLMISGDSIGSGQKRQINKDIIVSQSSLTGEQRSVDIRNQKSSIEVSNHDMLQMINEDANSNPTIILPTIDRQRNIENELIQSDPNLKSGTQQYHIKNFQNQMIDELGTGTRLSIISKKNQDQTFSSKDVTPKNALPSKNSNQQNQLSPKNNQPNLTSQNLAQLNQSSSNKIMLNISINNGMQQLIKGSKLQLHEKTSQNSLSVIFKEVNNSKASILGMDSQIPQIAKGDQESKLNSQNQEQNKHPVVAAKDQQNQSDLNQDIDLILEKDSEIEEFAKKEKLKSQSNLSLKPNISFKKIGGSFSHILELSLQDQSSKISAPLRVADVQGSLDFERKLSKLSSQISLKKKVSVLELLKNEEGVPLKLNDEDYYLTLQKFQSRSEQMRFIKNSKIIRDLLDQYQLNPNHYEVSNQFLKDQLMHSDYKRLTIAEIDSLRQLIIDRDLDLKKDIISALKEVFNSHSNQRMLILKHKQEYHLGSKRGSNQSQKSMHQELHHQQDLRVSQDGLKPFTNKKKFLSIDQIFTEEKPNLVNPSYKRWTDKMTPRTLKIIMQNRKSNTQTLNVKQLLNNKESLIFMNHTPEQQDKQIVLAKYIIDHSKYFSPQHQNNKTIIEPLLIQDQTAEIQNQLKSLQNEQTNQKSNEHFFNVRNGKNNAQMSASLQVEYLQMGKNDIEKKLIFSENNRHRINPSLEVQSNLGAIDNAENFKIQNQNMTDLYEKNKVASRVNQGNYQKLFENVFESASKISQDQMKRQNLLLEHVMLEREQQMSKQLQKEKLKKKNLITQQKLQNTLFKNTQWWKDDNDQVQVDLFQLPIFKQQY
eukprot:403356128